MLSPVRDNRNWQGYGSAVPTGLETRYLPHSPSSELLGYCRASLRDETALRLVCNSVCGGLRHTACAAYIGKESP